MISIKSSDDLDEMRQAGKIVSKIFTEIKNKIIPGITTLELDNIASVIINSYGARPAFLGYRGYPKNTCISVNEQIVHGIPDDTVIKDGDIVSFDVGVELNGFYSDAARTYPVGKIKPEAMRLVDICRNALKKATDKMRKGNKLSDISRTIQQVAEVNGYSVVRSFVGHGIGKEMHEAPQVPNFISRELLANDLELKPGIVLAIEPMINIGTSKVKISRNKWTAYTADKKLSTHFENTIAVTEDEPEILTE